MPRYLYDPDIEELFRTIDPRWSVLSTWGFEGHFFGRTFGVETSRPNGKRRKFVVRNHDYPNTCDPELPRREFDTLEVAESLGLKVPHPVYLADGGPLVIEYVDGTQEGAPRDPSDRVKQMAAELARVHRIEEDSALSFLPRRHEEVRSHLGIRPDQLDDSLSEGRIRDALSTDLSWLQPGSRLLHGDYWPGNILWRDGRIVAVIDWEDAAVGVPLSDVGSARLEILWALGWEAMEIFTDFYLNCTGADPEALPYWDLWGALRPASKLQNWGFENSALERMRGEHLRFTNEALSRLGAV